MTGTDGALLRAHFPDLARRLEEAGEADPSFAVERTGDGEPTLRVRGLLAHSVRDPRREARKLAELSRGEGPLVVLGFGLGYLAEAAIELDPSRPLIIVDRDLGSVALAFRERDLSRLIAREGTVFVIGGPPDSVQSALGAFDGRPSIASNRAVRSLDEAWYGAAESAVRTWAAKEETNAATLKRFGKRWVRNLAANLDSIRDLPGVARLAGCASGIPAIILAAGPSLDEVLPFLPDLSRRCVVVAVDTALRALSAAGARADFVLVVDPQFWNARHLDRCPAPESALVTESATYPSVLRSMDDRAFRRAFLCSSVYPFGRFVEDRVDAKGILGAGGSVATTAWDFARLLGASPLFVAGLDLSFPELKTHFRGALFEERVHGESRRFCPSELRSFRALRDGQPFRAESAGGGSVLTDKRLALYAAWFESRFRRHADARPRSLSARGLRIAGMDTCSLDEILSLPDRRSEIDIRLETTFAEAERGYADASAVRERERRYAAAVDELSAGLAELAAIADKAGAACAAAIAELDAAKDTGVAATLDSLDAANRAIAASPVKDVAAFLFPPLSDLEADLDPAPGDTVRRHLELSVRLYGGLSDSAGYHAAILAAALKRAKAAVPRTDILNMRTRSSR